MVPTAFANSNSFCRISVFSPATVFVRPLGSIISLSKPLAANFPAVNCSVNFCLTVTPVLAPSPNLPDPTSFSASVKKESVTFLELFENSTTAFLNSSESKRSPGLALASSARLLDAASLSTPPKIASLALFKKPTKPVSAAFSSTFFETVCSGVKRDLSISF